MSSLRAPCWSPLNSPHRITKRPKHPRVCRIDGVEVLPGQLGVRLVMRGRWVEMRQCNRRQREAFEQVGPIGRQRLGSEQNIKGARIATRAFYSLLLAVASPRRKEDKIAEALHGPSRRADRGRNTILCVLIGRLPVAVRLADAQHDELLQRIAVAEAAIDGVASRMTH